MPIFTRNSQPARYLQHLGILTVIYFVAGKLSLQLATVHPSATPVWPPTGIALTVFLLFGSRYWPAIFVGAFLVNLSTAGHLGSSLGIAFGNTLEALTASFLIRHYANGKNCFDRSSDVIRYAFLAGALSTVISATIGVSSLVLGRLAPSGAFSEIWITWWLGDAMGALIIAPALILISRNFHFVFSRGRVIEASIVGSLIILLGVLTFSNIIFERSTQYALSFLFAPLVVFAGFRMGQRGSALVALSISVLAMAGTLNGVGPFTSANQNQVLLLLQSYTAVLTVIGLAIAATTRERRGAEQRLEVQYIISRELEHPNDFVDAARNIIAAIGRNFAWDAGALWIEERQRLICKLFWSSSHQAFTEFERETLNRTTVPGEDLPGQVWQEVQARWLVDLDSTPDFPRRVSATASGLKSGFAFPVTEGVKGCAAVIEFFSSTSRVRDHDMIKMLSSVGSQIGQVLAQKRVEADIQRSEALKSAILNSALDCVISLDADQRIVEFNPSAEVTFGYPRDRIIGKNGVDVLVPERFRRVYKRGLERFLKTGVGPVLGRRTEMVGLRSDGSEFPVEMAITTTHLEPGVICFTVYVRDISDLKQSELEKTRLLVKERIAREQAEHAGRMKEEFLATLSHELRTPLNAILGYAQLAARGQLTGDKLTSGLQIIERNARMQARIIDDLLDMNRIISGKLRLDIQSVRIESVILAALDTVKPAAEAKEIVIEHSIEPGVREAGVDPDRMQQVIWNLLANAVKFTPHRGRIAVHTRQRNQMIEIEISDSGVGIGPEFLPHVFERFLQADSSFNRKHGGLGLGLAIVKQLIEMHGGSIEARSEGADKGSVFIIRLPQAASQVKEPVPDVPIAAFRNEPPVTEPGVSLSGLRILAVDDEADSRTLVKDILQSVNADVTTASSSAEGLKLLSSARFDLIISDIGMPETDGYQFIRQMRTLPVEGMRQTPAIALTAFAMSTDQQVALDSGFQAYLSKPVEASSLILLVKRLCEKDSAPPANADRPAEATLDQRNLAS